MALLTAQPWFPLQSLFLASHSPTSSPALYTHHYPSPSTLTSGRDITRPCWSWRERASSAVATCAWTHRPGVTFTCGGSCKGVTFACGGSCGPSCGRMGAAHATCIESRDTVIIVVQVYFTGECSPSPVLAFQCVCGAS